MLFKKSVAVRRFYVDFGLLKLSSMTKLNRILHDAMVFQKERKPNDQFLVKLMVICGPKIYIYAQVEEKGLGNLQEVCTFNWISQLEGGGGNNFRGG